MGKVELRSLHDIADALRFRISNMLAEDFLDAVAARLYKAEAEEMELRQELEAARKVVEAIPTHADAMRQHAWKDGSTAVMISLEDWGRIVAARDAYDKAVGRAT